MADKEFLVDVSFDVDEGGASTAQNAVTGLKTVAQQLGKILMQTAQTIKSFFGDMGSGSGQADAAASSMDNAANAAEELSGSEANAAQAAAEMASSQVRASAAASDSSGSFDEAGSSATAMGQAMGGAGSVANGAVAPIQAVGQAAQTTAQKAKQAAAGLKEAGRQASMSNAKTGAENLGQLREQFQKVSETIKGFIAAAATALIGSSIGQAFKDIASLNAELAGTAKQLKTTIEGARAHTVALQTMGKTADDIKKNASLKATYNDLVAIGKQMALPEAAQGVNAIQRLKDGLMQLKVVGNYALQWIYYKIQTVAEGPLATLRDTMTGMRDWFSGNIEKIATTVATAFSWVVQIFNSVVQVVKGIAGAIDSLPPSIKAAGAIAIAVIAAVHSKAFLITAIVGAILLLLDDLVTYMNGGESLFGDFWGACIEWAQKVTPAIQAVIDWLSSFITSIWNGTVSLIGWLNEAGLIEPLIAGVTAAFAAFKALKLAPAIKNVVSALNILPKVLTAITSPAGIVIAVIAVLAAAFTTLWKSNEEFRTKVTGIWNSVVAKFTEFGNAIVSRLNGLGFSFANIGEVIKAIWNGLCEFLGPVFIAAFELIQNGLSFALDAIIGLFDFFKALFTGDWSGMWEAVSSIFSSFWNGIVNIFSICLNMLRGIADVVLGWFGTSWEEVWSSVSSFFTGIWNGIVSFFTSAWEGIKSVWSTVAGFFAGIWESISANPTLAGIINTITAPFNTAWTIVKAVWESVAGFFSGIWGLITGDGTLVDLWSKVSQPFVDAWNSF